MQEVCLIFDYDTAISYISINVITWNHKMEKKISIFVISLDNIVDIGKYGRARILYTIIDVQIFFVDSIRVCIKTIESFNFKDRGAI
jgi:hypothetical protein